jgi:hypothetical protein
VNQPVDAAHQGGFAGAGKPHNDKHLARFNGEGDIIQADNAAGLILDLIFGGSLLDQLNGKIGVLAKDFVDILYFDFNDTLPFTRTSR